ncbi:tetratricopeptide repeat protein [Saccharothrix deserti]|uniref:tetratricopeptide repeat protein n=1 Tax=Saccharothrix deserti TaxID=2593674 RepID=UPI00131B2D36|nr:tetratricopeptide repeat protein [Saccharothrix deserti]
MRLNAENVLSGAAYGPVVQAGSVGSVHFNTARAEPVIPYQLPPAPKLFTSRRRELAALDGWLEADEALVVVVSGPGGVGKTSLALRWLHGVRSRFPDGQLYVDLAVRTPGGPTTPEEVLEWFLLALGVPAAEIPSGLARRQAAFRTLTADRAVALLLDNAISAAQVRPLLPTSARSAVVVTSRWRLGGLAVDGARFVEVGSFDEDSSVELLERAVGSRVTSEPDAARELAHLCAGLPIALSVIGARLSTRPRRSLSKEVGSLRAERLATLALDDGVSVEAVFDLSYVDLPPRHARVYRLCALHPGASFGVEAAAAAAGEPVSDVEQVLEELVEKNLLTEVGDERFGFHDLLRLHARRHADRASHPERDAALRRLAEWYLDRLVDADLALRPTRRRVGPRYHDRRSSFPTQRDALVWLERERTNLREACRIAHDLGLDEVVWQFCEAMWGFFLHARHYVDWFAVHDLGVPAAMRCGNRAAEAKLRAQLAFTYSGLRRFQAAEREGLRALEIAEEDGDDQGVAVALTELGGVAQGAGEPLRAMERLVRAREIRQHIGPPRAEALCARRIGEVLTELGRDDEAMAELEAAADAMGRLGDRAGQARCLMSVGAIALRRGRPDAAEESLETALDLLHRVGAPFYEAEVLVMLGEVAESAGDLPRARERYGEALRLFESLGNPQAATISVKLSALDK